MLGTASGFGAFEVEGVAEGIVEGCEEFLLIGDFGKDGCRGDVFLASVAFSVVIPLPCLY